jgi:RNA-directed DNA polymerase
LSLAHYIDLDFLHEAFRRTRKDGATGVDGQTGEEYEERLEQNLRSLLDRFKSDATRHPRCDAPTFRKTTDAKGR